MADKIEFAVFGSFAFATDSPQETAESAAANFRAVRQIGAIGSIHMAHISKADGGDQKPFGRRPQVGSGWSYRSVCSSERDCRHVDGPSNYQKRTRVNRQID